MTTSTPSTRPSLETVVGLVLPEEDPIDPRDDFQWLDNIENDDCYLNLDVKNCADKSRDFGRDGFTGSVSAWHELLQITAPDEECGPCFVRGYFPDTGEAILARAQRRNQSGTFGLGVGIPSDANYVLEIAASGLINLRWPCTKFNLVRNDSLHSAIIFATYTICSLVKDQTVHQISRITPIRVPTSSPAAESRQAGRIPLNRTSKKFNLDVGGIMRFGCPSSAAEIPA
ncbi:hypothetical protein B0T18DRAFT_394152 [Schizothecium vesticola]|uniref:Uncharacterized protein n=1 Tax=Schizothecium vesticola TaxID=314040 RepID=A0AA40ELL8_9PEZI|nr:hypothetical protein B0T18DRAFT_394152 [Schizothecium vesticola]